MEDQENRYTMPVQRGTREPEVAEVNFGFMPNYQDTAAWLLSTTRVDIPSVSPSTISSCLSSHPPSRIVRSDMSVTSLHLHSHPHPPLHLYVHIHLPHPDHPISLEQPRQALPTMPKANLSNPAGPHQSSMPQ
ncbi:uncharacterized protein F5147DRAFT_834699, partial [Suillus discolor]